ncbi:hypothetical protein LINPERPRIM_LOCUS12167 [Linum perenne]
MLSFPSG